jgi:hypothetical protein
MTSTGLLFDAGLADMMWLRRILLWRTIGV